MKFLMMIFIFTMLFGVYLCKEEKTLSAIPSFDMYVFAIQWGSTLCLGQSEDCKNRLAAIPKNCLSIHGLWPSLKSGGSIEECNQGTAVQVTDDGSSVFLNMRKYWASLTSENPTFWGHEYNKHGYCYSNYIGDFDYKKYFQKALDIFIGRSYQKLITNVFGVQATGDYSVEYATFISKMTEYFGGKNYALVCKSYNSKQYLNEIRVALDLNFNYIASTLSSGTCSSKKPIYIPYQ